MRVMTSSQAQAVASDDRDEAAPFLAAPGDVPYDVHPSTRADSVETYRQTETRRLTGRCGVMETLRHRDMEAQRYRSSFRFLGVPNPGFFKRISQ